MFKSLMMIMSPKKYEHELKERRSDNEKENLF